MSDVVEEAEHVLSGYVHRVFGSERVLPELTQDGIVRILRNSEARVRFDRVVQRGADVIVLTGLPGEQNPPALLEGDLPIAVVRVTKG